MCNCPGEGRVCDCPGEGRGVTALLFNVPPVVQSSVASAHLVLVCAHSLRAWDPCPSDWLTCDKDIIVN